MNIVSVRLRPDNSYVINEADGGYHVPIGHVLYDEVKLWATNHADSVLIGYERPVNLPDDYGWDEATGEVRYPLPVLRSLKVEELTLQREARLQEYDRLYRIAATDIKGAKDIVDGKSSIEAELVTLTATEQGLTAIAYAQDILSRVSISDRIGDQIESVLDHALAVVMLGVKKSTTEEAINRVALPQLEELIKE